MVSKASKWMNEHIAPHEFLGLTVFDDHHPIDKENQQRNIIIYHQAGPDPQPLKEMREDIVGQIFSFTILKQPEDS